MKVTKATLADNWTIALDGENYRKAMACARGDYQRGIVDGHENLSGSSLRGAAKEWSSRYAHSRRALLSRMTAAGVVWREETGPHSRRVLVLGEEVN